MKALALTTLLLLAALGSHAQADVDLEPASRLVKTLRLDELHMNLFRNTFRSSLDEKTITPSQWKCYESIKLAEFTHLLASLYAREYLQAELESANEFYSSPVGSKLMRMAYKKNWETNPKEFPLRMDGPKETMKFSELADFARFRETPGGLRLSNVMGILEDKKSRLEILTFIIEKRIVCEELR